jgi:hypothetical protein
MTPSVISTESAGDTIRHPGDKVHPAIVVAACVHFL